MDTERLAELVSTLVIVGGIAFVALRSFGVESLQDRLLYSAAIAVVLFGPIVYYVVYHTDYDSEHVGPFDLTDVVFLVAVIPGLLATAWIANTYAPAGAIYLFVLLVGIVGSILLAVVIRDATVGDWPPGSGVRSRRDRGPGR